MIKLTLPPTPDSLTTELVRRLTDAFRADKTKNVWNRPDLKDALMAITNGKCAYSEAKLNQEGKYMQVDHFYPKSIYEKRVVEWGNLLPCINICNMKKGDLDPNTCPIVNPLKDDPKEYFFILNGGLYPLTYECKKAVNTIVRCDLNNDRHFRKIRSEIEKGLGERLEDILDLYREGNVKSVARLRSIMNDSGRKASYSATKSTFILSNPSYNEIKCLMVNDGYWDKDFVSLEQELVFCSLPPKKTIY